MISRRRFYNTLEWIDTFIIKPVYKKSVFLRRGFFFFLFLNIVIFNRNMSMCNIGIFIHAFITFENENIEIKKKTIVPTQIMCHSNNKSIAEIGSAECKFDMSCAFARRSICHTPYIWGLKINSCTWISEYSYSCRTDTALIMPWEPIENRSNCTFFLFFFFLSRTG